MRSSLLVVALAALAFPALGAAPAQKQQPVNPTAIRITPSDLFTGELKRLEPHLGLLATDCVKLHHKGPPVYLSQTLRVYRYGKGGIGVGSLDMHLSGPGVASVSVKETTDSKGRPKYRVVLALLQKGRNESATYEMDVPETRVPFHQPPFSKGRPKDLAGPAVLKKGESVVVWGLMAGKGTDKWVGDESVEEMAKRVEWALLLTLDLKTVNPGTSGKVRADRKN